MKTSMGKIALRLVKISGIVLASLLFILLLLPFLFPQSLSDKIKSVANSHINGKLNFTTARLSFFNHFPSLTLTLQEVNLKGSAPFQNETLLAANEIAFGINLASLLTKQIKVNQVFFTDAHINVLVDKSGAANYNVYISKPSKTTQPDSSSAELKIERIVIENSRLVYNDQSLPMLIDAKGFNYSGKGDLSKAIFDLHTKLEVDSMDFAYGGQPYLLSKKVSAELVTKINTNSLAFIFEKNDLMINQLPVDFKGRFEFLSNGYNMDFKLKSKTTDLRNIITALPRLT